MKTIYISDLLSSNQTGNVILSGWLSNRRHVGKIVFLDISDSTGTIQATLEKGNVSGKMFSIALHTSLESSVEVKGKLNSSPSEITVSNFIVISEDTLNLSPRPRSNFDIFDPSLTKQMLDYRHIYLRNPKIMAILRFRGELMQIIREWFFQNRFVEFDAPILTPAPLYDNRTAMSIDVHDQSVYLTQCAGFYLEAAVHAFERVFNLGPSFRGEESRSKRHLIEYWHVKAEIAFGNREDIILLVEDIIGHITRECQVRCKDLLKILGSELCVDGLESPFSRITYEDAIKHLQSKSYDTHFGKSISTAEEEELSKLYDNAFWIIGIPRSVEPFPYVIDESDTRITMVADLIASNGCGELLGVAEKIHTSSMLNERLEEKGKLNDPRYQFVKEVHAAGCVPHIAFGMGLERLIRWLLNLPHVRDAIPFPRVIRRNIAP
ncbi:asparagine--tRNA ligase [Patescibacteria group bacterium]|nr:asparagine--tRNA ligase [Patescibacteria group bacterium]